MILLKLKRLLRINHLKEQRILKRTVMLTGVNDSTKETKFVSEAYKLVEGKHLENEDKNKNLNA